MSSCQMDFRIDGFDVFEKGDFMETIRNVEINQLHDFKNHPFKVEVNTELCELMKSIEKEGVIVPLLIRTNPYGDGYEVRIVEAFGEYDTDRVTFNHDIRANAKGYEYYCYMILKHQ